MTYSISKKTIVVTWAITKKYDAITDSRVVRINNTALRLRF